jgi:hypothetical protein
LSSGSHEGINFQGNLITLNKITIELIYPWKHLTQRLFWASVRFFDQKVSFGEIIAKPD